MNLERKSLMNSMEKPSKPGDFPEVILEMASNFFSVIAPSKFPLALSVNFLGHIYLENVLFFLENYPERNRVLNKSF